MRISEKEKQARMLFQQKINQECVDEFRGALQELEEARISINGYLMYSKFHKFLHCQASYIHTRNYTILLSYDTIVCVINRNNMIAYDFLRYVYGYTATSAQHITKFIRYFDAKEKYTYRVI